MIEQLPATALREWLDNAARGQPLVVDVREPWEHAICHLETAQLLPMQEITSRWQELPRDRDIVVLCHHGMRSLQVADFLHAQGYTRLYNLSGGIAAWADEVEPSMAQY